MSSTQSKKRENNKKSVINPINDRLFIKQGKVDRTKVINTFEFMQNSNSENLLSSDDIPKNLKYSNMYDSNDLNIDRFNKNKSFLNMLNDSSDELSLSENVDYIEYYSGSDSDNNMQGGSTSKHNIKDSNNYNRYIGRASYVYESENVYLDNNKNPLVCEVNVKNMDISKYEPHPIIHNDVDYPKFSMAFHHWIHASKNKTEVFNKFKGKKKIYQVVNGYERYIDNHEDNIGNVSKKYFNLNKNKPDILSRAFYKLWEILYYYDIIDTKKSFKSAHLAEGPGSFIQATMFFRDMYAKDSKNDKYYAITIHSESEDDNVPELEKQFVDYYKNEKPQRFFMHKTYDKQTAGGSKKKDNGDLTKVKTIENFKNFVKDKVDLVTGDGGFDWNNENIQEQECAFLIYSQILTAINIQKKGGSFVLKTFETFTRISLKFILILKYFYEHVDIIKPLTSRDSNSERYFVCRNFRFEEKQITNVLSKMMLVLNNINQDSEQHKYLFDIYPDIIVPNELFLNVTNFNKIVANNQFKVINKMIEFIEGSNYHGDLYTHYRERQILLSNYWIKQFMNDKQKYDNTNTTAMLENSKKISASSYDKISKTLIGYDIQTITRKQSRTKTKTKSKSKKTKSKPKKTKTKSKPKKTKTKSKPKKTVRKK